MEPSSEFDSERAIAEDGKESLLQGSDLAPPRQLLHRFCRKAGALATVAAMLAAVLLLGSGRFDWVADLAKGRGIVAVPEQQQSSPRMAGHVLGLDAVADMQVMYATCVIDVDQALGFLMQGANFIKISIVDCEVIHDGVGRRLCASDVITVVTSMAWVSSYLAFAASTCSVSDSIPAICAGSLTGLIAVMGELSFAASAVRDACEVNPRRLQGLPKFDLNATGMPKLLTSPAPHRGLAKAKHFFDQYSAKLKEDAAKIKALQADPARKAFQSQCFVDVNVGLSYVARVGLQTSYLAQECPPATKGKICIIDIFNVLGSIGDAIQFLAQIPIDCPGVDNMKAACAATLSDFIEDFCGLGPVVNGIADDCRQLDLPPGSPLPVGPGNFA